MPAPVATSDTTPQTPPLSTSVQPLETLTGSHGNHVLPLLPEQPTEPPLTFRHSFWHVRRLATRAALVAAGASPARLDRFDNCGAHAWVMVDPNNNDHVRLACDRCHDRFCEACQSERRRTIARNLREQLPTGPLRLLTLTLKSYVAPLSSQLDRLYACWDSFRKHPKIAPLLAGGLAFFEVTRNPDTDLWHPHLHVLFTGHYIAKELARSLWLQITGDSFVVDLKFLHDANAAAGYVTKYAAKAIATNVWQSPPHLLEAITAFAGRRTFNAFGTWHKLSLARTPDDGVGWLNVAPLWEILRDAAAGDPDARRILRLLHRSGADVPIDAFAGPGPPPVVPDLFNSPF